MSNEPLSAGLEKFIARYVHSVEQLEIVCLFAENSRNWLEAEVCRQIQSSEDSVSKNLKYLVDEGFLACDPKGVFSFAPKTNELMQLTGELTKTYRQRRVTIVETIYKMRSDPIRHFSDAFRFRKDES